MKKIKMLILCLLICMLCGCMKLEYNMTINENGKVDYNILFITSNDYYESLNNETDLIAKKMQINGYEKSGYLQNNYRGYTFTRTVDNIEYISSENVTNHYLDDIILSNGYAFEKIGNKYKAVWLINDESTLIKEYYNHLSSAERSNSDAIITFTINLPVSATTNNADFVDNDSKTLTWKYSQENVKDIEFEFYLDENTTNDNSNSIIFIVIAIIIVAIIIALIIFIRKKKIKKSSFIAETSINMEQI